MKTRIVFWLLLIVCFSCGTNNNPPSDAQKEKIKGEIKEVVNTFYKGCEEVNMDMALGTCLNSPEFAYINNGYVYSYKECADIFKPVFESMLNQKITIVDEKFTFPDHSTVFYSNHCKSLTNYKDGHAILQDPTVMLLIFKKINSTWKIIYGVESYIQQNAKNTETSKELNQVELMKQMRGTWKLASANDTTIYFDFKPYGTGLEGNLKWMTKGKMFMEAKQLWGYDGKMDKFTVSMIVKGTDMEIIAFWFTSKSKFVVMPYSDIANPETASWKYEGEFKSPDVFTETLIVNKKAAKTDTYNRAK
jgi:hypothetical protein